MSPFSKNGHFAHRCGFDIPTHPPFVTTVGETMQSTSKAPFPTARNKFSLSFLPFFCKLLPEDHQFIDRASYCQATSGTR